MKDSEGNEFGVGSILVSSEGSTDDKFICTEIDNNIATLTFNPNDGSVPEWQCTVDQEYITNESTLVRDTHKSAEHSRLNRLLADYWECENCGGLTYKRFDKCVLCGDPQST